MHDTGIKIYSKYNEEESSLAERFIRNLDTKIYKHITAVSENGFINVLDEIVYKYHKTYHRTFKLRPSDVKGDTYIDYDVEHNDKYRQINLKLVVVLEYQTTKIILREAILQTGQKKSLWSRKSKLPYHRHIDCMFLSCHVVFQSEATLYSCLNVKQILA